MFLLLFLLRLGVVLVYDVTRRATFDSVRVRKLWILFWTWGKWPFNLISVRDCDLKTDVSVLHQSFSSLQFSSLSCCCYSRRSFPWNTIWGAPLSPFLHRLKIALPHETAGSGSFPVPSCEVSVCHFSWFVLTKLAIVKHILGLTEQRTI